MTQESTAAASPKATDRRSSVWDLQNAPQNYISLVAYQAGSAVFSFGAVWVITRFLGSEGYGGILAIIAASQIALVLVNWTGVAVVRFGVDEFIETEKIARTFWLRLLILSANLSLVAALSPFWFPILADWLKLTPQSFWFVMAHFAVTALWIHAVMSLQGAKLMRTQGLLQFIERVVIFAGLLALAVNGSLTSSSAMIFYIAAPGATTLLALIILRKYVLAQFTINREFVLKFVSFSLPLLPFSVVGYFSGNYLDAVFVTKFLSTRDLGIYSVATQINGIAMQLPTLANTLLLPMFITLRSEADNERTSNYFQNVLPTLTLLGGFLCSIFSLAAFYTVPLVFGSEFAGSVLPLLILVSATAISLPFFLGFSSMAQASSLTYIQAISASLAAAANVLFNLILIPRYGMAGCAWATFISYLVSVVVTTCMVRMKTTVRVSWSFVAMAPALLFAVIFSLIENIWLSVAVCVGLSFLLAYYYRASLAMTILFAKNLIGRKV